MSYEHNVASGNLTTETTKDYGLSRNNGNATTTRIGYGDTLTPVGGPYYDVGFDVSFKKIQECR